jgi:hypothetical protein
MTPAECWAMKQDILHAAKQAKVCKDQYTYEAFLNSETPQEAWNIFWANASCLHRSGIMEITELPDGLTVGGTLDLAETSVTSLPKGLKVGNRLNLRGTLNTKLPDDLEVGGSIEINYCETL